MMKGMRRDRMLGILFGLYAGISSLPGHADGPPAKEELPIPQTNGDEPKGRSKEDIRVVIRSHIHEVKSCFERGLTKQPQLQGKVIVKFTIAPSGEVPRAIVHDSTIANSDVEECILTAVRSWVFPKPQTGIQVVTYPFTLLSADSPRTCSAPTARTDSSQPASRPSFVPSILINKEKLQGDIPHLPDAVKRERCGIVIESSYKLCLDVDGSVSSVHSIVGIPGADDAICATLWRWRYKPREAPVCFVQVFEHRLEGCPSGKPDAAPAARPEQLSMVTIKNTLQAIDLSPCGLKSSSEVVMVRLTIAGSGQVSTANALSKTPSAACVVKQVQSATFAAFSGPPMTLTFPFTWPRSSERPDASKPKL